MVLGDIIVVRYPNDQLRYHIKLWAENSSNYSRIWNIFQQNRLFDQLLPNIVQLLSQT